MGMVCREKVKVIVRRRAEDGIALGLHFSARQQIPAGGVNREQEHVMYSGLYLGSQAPLCMGTLERGNTAKQPNGAVEVAAVNQ
jgi:hypothetical protein